MLQTAGVDIEIEVGEGASIESISERIGNPDTGDIASFTWLWIALAAMLPAVGTAGASKSLNAKTQIIYQGAVHPA